MAIKNKECANCRYAQPYIDFDGVDEEGAPINRLTAYGCAMSLEPKGCTMIKFKEGQLVVSLEGMIGIVTYVDTNLVTVLARDRSVHVCVPEILAIAHEAVIVPSLGWYIVNDEVCGDLKRFYEKVEELNNG